MELQGRDLKRDMRGDDVALLQRELMLLGYAVPDVERRDSFFGDVTHQIVQRFQREHGTQVTGVVDAQTAHLINSRVNAETVTVEGRITSPTRASVAGLQVHIVDKNVGADVVLFNTTTDDTGRYTATFSIATLREHGKLLPDLQARALQNTVFLGASEVRYNSAKHETLNILLGEKVSNTLASEHETLLGSISTHFKGKLADLKETDEQQDVTYLANKSGWDARAVALAALADQFSVRTANGGAPPAIAPPLFYALFRAGLPANEDALYQIDAKIATAIWQQGIDQGIIPVALANDIPAAATHFQTLVARRALEVPALPGLSPLKDMLSVSRVVNATQQQKFAHLYTRHRGDWTQLWEAVRGDFGEAVEKRLKLDGQLAYLTLNNAPLIGKLHAAVGQGGLSDTLKLVEEGFYRAARWQAVIGTDPVPPQIPGADDQERRARYAELLSAQVRLSFPTMVVAQMVKNSETPVAGTPAIRDSIAAFLSAQQGKFEIGMQPIEQFIARNNVQITPEVTNEVKRIQRVYQITPSDTAMNALLKKKIGSAYDVVKYEQDEFIQTVKDEVGGAAQARLIYTKAQQVHSAVLNIATSYVIANTTPAIGGHNNALIVKPMPRGLNPQAANAGDVIAYPTLEGLFGEMDYCECEHCRSILSPAAYLVNLLQFIDPEQGAWTPFLAKWRSDHGGAPYPFANIAAWNNAGSPVDTEVTPLQVLLSRRPDVQHLPLTCENTNTPLPYIDVVNETLEYFVANNLTLNNYRGHSIDSEVRPEDLMASPQFVSEGAYATLKAEVFPPPLPFHQPLENLRRYFDTFEIPLPKVMAALRKDDNMEGANANEYGWRDILIEELKLSRAEYALLTDRTVSLQQLYGYPQATPIPAMLAELANAKAFSRRVGITYEDIIEILKTRFVNPNSTLIPKLERLGVSFAALKVLKDSQVTGQAWLNLLPQPVPDASHYGGNIETWVKNNANFARIMGLITLSNPNGAEDLSRFDNLEFRYANPDNTANSLRAFEYVRLFRFIRLWKKLGWTIEQTDKAITALYPASQSPNDPNDAVNLQRLDAGFLVLLPRLGEISRIKRALNLTVKKDLLPLLACFAPIDTHGAMSLYGQMFLSSAQLKQDTAFADDGFGNFLTNNTEKLTAHAETLRAAFLLTDGDLQEISTALGFDANTQLTLDNISAVFRRGWLARKLKLSVRELLLLSQFTGFDPFAAPDAPHPSILRLIELRQKLRATSLKPIHALYLMWNRDLSGKSVPSDRTLLDFARNLRTSFVAIENEFTVSDDPEGQIARARMALVYGNEASDFFFGLLGNTLTTEVAYSHGQSKLEPAITNTALDRIAYDDFRKQLSYSGVLITVVRDALKAVTGVSPQFRAAVDSIYAKNHGVVDPFFARYPELALAYNNYDSDTDPTHSPAVKRNNFLKAILPELVQRRKRQQTLQAVSAVVKTDLAFTQTFLDPPVAPFPLHAVGLGNQPAVTDVLALETSGLSVQFFANDIATGTLIPTPDIASNLDYAPAVNGVGNPLPVHPTPGAAISAVWRGYLEAPESGFFNLRIETDAGATVTLVLGDKPIALTSNATFWVNAAPIELRAGTLYPITLTVEKVRNVVRVGWEWQPKGQGRAVIPPRYLYPATLFERFRETYIRFLKTASLGTGLSLSANELAYFALQSDYRVNGDGWLNALSVSGTPPLNTAAALRNPLEALLDFARIKAEISSGDESLLTVLKDPATATQNASSLLFTLTGWTPESLNALLTRFGKGIADLSHFDIFRRIYDALVPVRTMGIAATALINATTNEPSPTTVRDLQSALRARYDEAQWLNVLKPINDEMRGVQRDALVSFILHRLRQQNDTKDIDTPDKLFEYFLMDVQMDPCTQTSRIRHALSSVQLFIERCLMNLEPRVSPSSIKAKQWEWMKRYRVWEANRKVFLWPENWLEPELRDDQSPFFKETMSELLQGDITEDRATIALLNYLAKLEEVAKLEPCGIHYLENEPDAADDIAHVVARTAGANRKYFYRRRERGSWTPWEQIRLDIEDNPVIPVMWMGRLLLFWLRILKQASSTSRPELPDKQLTEVHAKELAPPATQKVTVQAILCWSEYYNGKWQPTKTSDVNRPADLGQHNPSEFDRSALKLSVAEEVSVNGKGNALHVIIRGPGASSFLLFNTHSLPALQPNFSPPNAPRRIMRTDPLEMFAILYFPSTGRIDMQPRPVLATELEDKAVQPNHVLQNPLSAPFLYEDGRHVFYVTTNERIVHIREWNGYGIDIGQVNESIAIPRLVFKPAEVIPERFGSIVPAPNVGVVDHAPIERLVSEDAYIPRAIATTGTVRYGDKEISPVGVLTDRQTRRN